MNKTHGLLAFACLFSAALSGCSGGAGRPALRSDAGINADVQLERGIRAQQKGEFSQAEKFLSESYRIASSIDDGAARVIALINLARLNRINGRFDSAATHIDKAIIITESNSPLFIEAAYEKSLIELSKGNLSESLLWGKKTLPAESSEANGRFLNLLARIHYTSGNRADAVSFAQKALVENRRKMQLNETANSLRLLGMIERKGGLFAEAEKMLQEALNIDRATGDSGKIAADLEELAALEENRENTNLTIAYLERAFDVHINGGRIRKGASIRLKIAEIYRKTGNNSQAEKEVVRAEELERKAPPASQ